MKNNHQNHTNNGYILVTTLMVVSLAMVLVAYMINRSTVYIPLTKTVINREKAKELSFAGLQLAMSQLAYADVVEKEEKKDDDKKQQQPPSGQQAAQQGQQPQQKPKTDPAATAAKQFLKLIFPVLNKWQTFKLDYTKDGVDGEINICLMSEDGKLNINELYNFEKHEFNGNKKQQEELKNLLKSLFNNFHKESKEGQSPLFEAFEKFLKEKQDKLRDVTELITIKEFDMFKNNMFYSPGEQKETQEKKNLYLTDIFTIWSQTPTMNPWFFSTSMSEILGLERPKNIPDDVLKAFKTSYSWPQDWKPLFEKLYKKDFKSLPKNFQPLLSATFGPETFSVLSYGKVGDITHRIFAILERNTQDRQDKAPAKVTIKKIYWV